jgi:hypothetical protein
MKSFKFNSQVLHLGVMPSFEQQVIKNEPMFFNCSINFAYDNGGPITKSFINQIGKLSLHDIGNPIQPYKNPVIDTRVHMLMPCWFPAIPGFHHDDVPRNTSNGQPNYYNPEYHSQHIMALVNGDICPTQFALGECEMPDVVDDEVYYRKWHPIVDDLCNSGKLQRYDALGNPIIHFDAHSFHQATKATKAGWRWFARISWNTEREKNISNEFRKQVQIYIPAPEYRGW